VTECCNTTLFHLKQRSILIGHVNFVNVLEATVVNRALVSQHCAVFMSSSSYNVSRPNNNVSVLTLLVAAN
jgi:hypothetical protein